MSAKQLVVSGWSNSGKSTFTDWLALKHGFTRVDMDELVLSANPAPIVRTLAAMAATGDANGVVSTLRQTNAKTVIDWPYNPPANLFQALLAQGLPCWWFDADHTQARISFINRRRRGVAEFDAHANTITTYQSQLPAIYGARFLRTLHFSGTRLQQPDIWDTIRQVEGW